MVNMPENKVEFSKVVIQTKAYNRRLDQMWTYSLYQLNRLQL